MTARRTVSRVAMVAALLAALPVSCVLGSFEADRPDPSDGSGGAAPECMSPADCPQPMTPCESASCEGGKCGITVHPAGEAPGGDPNDCVTVTCDDMGVATVTPNPNEIPLDDGNQCTSEACSKDVAVHPAKPFATACPEGYCDGAGACITPPKCAVPADCPATDSLCKQYSCPNGACVPSLSPEGTECKLVDGFPDQCDGAGQCVDCVNGGGCSDCCVCSNNQCVPS